MSNLPTIHSGCSDAHDRDNDTTVGDDTQRYTKVRQKSVSPPHPEHMERETIRTLHAVLRRRVVFPELPEAPPTNGQLRVRRQLRGVEPSRRQRRHFVRWNRRLAFLCVGLRFGKHLLPLQMTHMFIFRWCRAHYVSEADCLPRTSYVKGGGGVLTELTCGIGPRRNKNRECDLTNSEFSRKKNIRNWTKTQNITSNRRKFRTFSLETKFKLSQKHNPPIPRFGAKVTSWQKRFLVFYTFPNIFVNFFVKIPKNRI